MRTNKHLLRLASIMLVVCLLFATAMPVTVGALPQATWQSNSALYLQNVLKFTPLNNVTHGSFLKAAADIVRPISSEAASSLDALSPLSDKLLAQDAVVISILATGMDELAQTYPAAKVAKTLRSAGLKAGAANGKYIACGVHISLFPQSFYSSINKNAVVSDEQANSLLVRIAEITGLVDSNIIGMVSDEDIFAKLNGAWNSSVRVKNPALEAIGEKAVIQGIVTGFNLRDITSSPRFNSATALTYGHSDFKHALQLVGLLRSEGLDAKVSLEPKTSAYEYMIEWGNPGPASDSYEVKKVGDRYIAYAKEYDIHFDFATVAQKKRFDSIIMLYAKKNESDQSGLIYGSWFQPLYFTSTAEKGYVGVIEHVITANSGQYITSIALPESSEDVKKGFKEISSSLSISTRSIWVDMPFYNYLKGESR